MRHRPSTLRDWAEIASRAREHISENCSDEDLCIDAVARAANASRRKLQRALAEDGTDYTRECLVARMERAARMLSQRYQVRVVAARSGFRSHAHFTRAFERYFGVTPQRYRRAAVLQHRIQWRVWKDKVDPVTAGSSEYFRRRKRWRENERELHRLVHAMLPAGRAALSANAPPERPVFDMRELHELRYESGRERWRDHVAWSEHYREWDADHWYDWDD